MPISSQALYFHLGMNADDDGFIQPKITMRQVGSTDDDLKVLLTKRFLLAFEGGVVVIKHWLIHNLIQKDRYHPTRFLEQKKRLFVKENKAYTETSDSVNKMLTEVRLGKVRLGYITSAKADEKSSSNEKDPEIEAVDDNGDPIAPRWKKKPKDENARLIMVEMEQRKGRKYTTPILQMAKISTMLKNGYTKEEILEEYEWLEQQDYWKSRGVDFSIVASQIHKEHN